MWSNRLCTRLSTDPLQASLSSPTYRTQHFPRIPFFSHIEKSLAVRSKSHGPTRRVANIRIPAYPSFSSLYPLDILVENRFFISTELLYSRSTLHTSSTFVSVCFHRVCFLCTNKQTRPTLFSVLLFLHRLLHIYYCYYF